jgi:hypothetical protein
VIGVTPPYALSVWGSRPFSMLSSRSRTGTGSRHRLRWRVGCPEPSHRRWSRWQTSRAVSAALSPRTHSYERRSRPASMISSISAVPRVLGSKSGSLVYQRANVGYADLLAIDEDPDPIHLRRLGRPGFTLGGSYGGPVKKNPFFPPPLKRLRGGVKKNP